MKDLVGSQGFGLAVREADEIPEFSLDPLEDGPVGA